MNRSHVLDPDLAALLASALAVLAATLGGAIVSALGGHRRRSRGESDSVC